MGNRLATTLDMSQEGDAVPLWGGAAGFPSNTMRPGLRSTSVPSAILIHPAIWPQQTWTKNGGCPVWGLGPHLTQCGRGQGLPPCQVSSWSIQPLGHSTPTLQTDRTGQRSNSIGLTVLQMVPHNGTCSRSSSVKTVNSHWQKAMFKEPFWEPDVSVGQWLEWGEIWMEPRIDGNVRPEHMVQLMDDGKPISRRCQLEYRRHRVAADVVIKAVRQRQVNVLHQPVNERRRAARLCATTKHRNGNGPWLCRACGWAWRHGRSTIFSVQRAGRVTGTGVPRSEIAATARWRG